MTVRSADGIVRYMIDGDLHESRGDAHGRHRAARALRRRCADALRHARTSRPQAHMTWHAAAP